MHQPPADHLSFRCSAAAAFWAAASLLRDPRTVERSRRRCLRVLVVLAQRPDRIGEQARAVLNGTLREAPGALCRQAVWTSRDA